MTIISIDGHIGAGGYELGKNLSKMFNLNYIDRMVLPANKIEIDNEYNGNLKQNIINFFEKFLNEITLGNIAADPNYYSADELMAFLTWDENGPKDFRYSHKNHSDILKKRNTVIVHRAALITLDSHVDIKVGIFANWMDRLNRIRKIEGIKNIKQASESIRRQEKLQYEFFMDSIGVNPTDPSIYDITFNSSLESLEMILIKIRRHIKNDLESNISRL
ncbi:MAG: hypothetical protein CL778_02380 [Chloroflexi bacterium]|nr:hypothetical protein [Chloroflexota bacterium]|tara:strand:- start:20637 stop:21293 length:657 start_codon:yes stop_codon:yes gene_type:complete